MKDRHFKDKHYINTHVKKDLLSVIYDERKCCLKTELISLLYLFCSTQTGNLLTIKTNSVLSARRIVFLARKVYGKNQLIKLTQKPNKRSPGKHLIELQMNNPDFEGKTFDGSFSAFSTSKKCCSKAFINGLYWKGGYLSLPGKGLRLELVLPKNMNKSLVEHAFSQNQLEMFYTQRRERIVAHITSAEKIEKFLIFQGATGTVLLLQDVLITRDIKNVVNRSVNCEVGNLRRSSNSSAKDLDAIEYLKNRMIFDNLPVKLQTVGEARVDNPDLTIGELGEILVPPLTKAGVFHRLKKLREAAENERKRQQ